jgi:asparagine synthase (glutamine-hydrolysing)
VCGILGSAGTRSREDVERALGLLRHRGPDSTGAFGHADGVIGMTRLAIIDLDTGDQPISSEDGSVTIVCNGELYNYVELREELRARGHRFATGSDVEVALHLYEDEGPQGFARLRGMFAIALWDERNGQLVLARDRFGIKPLYLADVDGALAFSSEIAPLLALGVRPEPDIAAIADVLSLGYVPGERTGFANVRALRPGVALVHDVSGRREVAFAHLEIDAAPLEETLAEAVRLHLRSDVPLAVLLSGGLDSSLIASLAAAELEELHTFTVGFGDAAFDEVEPARVIAQALGTLHHEVSVRPDAAADLPEIVRRLEEPNGDSSAIPLFYVCRAAAEEVKVALAGEGGDEVFGGYARYAWDARARRLGRALPTAALAEALVRVPGVRRRAAGRVKGDPIRRAVKLLRTAGQPAPERYFSWFALVTDDVKAELLGRATRSTAEVFAEVLRDAPPGVTDLGRLQAADLRTMLGKDLLVKADRMSMAHSLELRVPMLDNRVVAAGLALPDREKVRGVETKVAIRRLVEQRLGAAIARRPKQGFEVPIDRWLRGELAPLAKELLSRDRVARHGLLRPDAVEKRLAEHLRGDADHGLSLYGLMTLELWHEQFVESPPRTIVA